MNKEVITALKKIIAADHDSIKDLEKFLKEAKWNHSGEYQQIVIHEQKGDQIILADDSGSHDSITVSDIGRLLDGVTLEDTDKNLEMFWTNFQDVISW